jgi:hypothetical protein
MIHHKQKLVHISCRMCLSFYLSEEEEEEEECDFLIA